MSRPTRQQIEILVEFLEQNPGIAKGRIRTAYAKQETKRKWEDISIPLNAAGGAQKDGKSWAKYWADKKCALKKACALHAQSMRSTGGGPADVEPALTPFDQRLLAVMGGLQFATGDSHVALDPFSIPSTSQSQPPIQTQTIELEYIAPSEDIIINQESNASHIQNEESARDTTPPSQPRPRSTTETHRRERVRSRSLLEQERDRFLNIERQRVEAETITANAFAGLVQVIEEVANALNRISVALDRHRN